MTYRNRPDRTRELPNDDPPPMRSPLRIGYGSGLASEAIERARHGGDVPAPAPCADGRHRPDDDPEPGNRCKDCGRDLTWRGPGPNDWDLADPLEPEPWHVLPIGGKVTFRAPTGEAPRCQDPSCPDFGDPDFGEGTCPASHADPRPAPDDEPDDGAPFRPQWAPQLVTDVVKATLLRELAELVHRPRVDGPRGDFARGFETGFARALLSLGIHEAASPERKSLPRPDDATDQPADPALFQVAPWTREHRTKIFARYGVTYAPPEGAAE